ncbi:MAG: hypothetical protein SFY56_16015 [Bacteroidota bacterium]|nr:hypothetical protein [Bacteroidota bacterium]
MKGILNIKYSITLLLILLFTSSFCQVGTKYKLKKTKIGSVIRISPTKSLKLGGKYAKKDTTEFFLFYDSLNVYGGGIGMEIKFPKSFKNCYVSINMGVEDNRRSEPLTDHIFNKENRMTYYFSTEQDIQTFYESKLADIKIYSRDKTTNEMSGTEVIVTDEAREYFYNFFQLMPFVSK